MLSFVVLLAEKHGLVDESVAEIPGTEQRLSVSTTLPRAALWAGSKGETLRSLGGAQAAGTTDHVGGGVGIQVDRLAKL